MLHFNEMCCWLVGTKWGICFLFKGGALAEGFQERLMEFQSFERTFEVRMLSNCSHWLQDNRCLTTRLKTMKIKRSLMETES